MQNLKTYVEQIVRDLRESDEQVDFVAELLARLQKEYAIFHNEQVGTLGIGFNVPKDIEPKTLEMVRHGNVITLASAIASTPAMTETKHDSAIIGYDEHKLSLTIVAPARIFKNGAPR